MANAWYTKGKENVLNANIVLLTDTIKAVFVDGADYTPNLSTDNALDDIPGGARVGPAFAGRQRDQRARDEPGRARVGVVISR